MKSVTSSDIRHAVEVLKAGGVIAYPTETVYGLGCDPRNARAIRKIHRLKGRDPNKPLSLVAATILQVRKVARLDGMALKIAKKYWPGPLTLVLPSRTKGTVAIRVSSSRIVQKLCSAFGYPIVSTSANRSGQSELRSGRGVQKLFAESRQQPDLVIDAGTLPRRKPSTIVRVQKDGVLDILRQGTIPLVPFLRGGKIQQKNIKVLPSKKGRLEGI